MEVMYNLRHLGILGISYTVILLNILDRSIGHQT